MSKTRNYTDHALEQFAQELDAGEKKMLVAAGAMPNDPFGELHLSLRSSDVARLIEIVRESD